MRLSALPPFLGWAFCWKSRAVSNILVILLFVLIYGFVMKLIIRTQLHFLTPKYCYLEKRLRRFSYFWWKWKYSFYPVCRSYTHNPWDQQERVISLSGLRIHTTLKLLVLLSLKQEIWARFVAAETSSLVCLEEFNSVDHFLHLNQLQAVLTSIVLKRNVTMLDIVSTRMLGQFGFLAKVRDCFWLNFVLSLVANVAYASYKSYFLYVFLQVGVLNIWRFGHIRGCCCH